MGTIEIAGFTITEEMVFYQILIAAFILVATAVVFKIQQHNALPQDARAVMQQNEDHEQNDGVENARGDQDDWNAEHDSDEDESGEEDDGDDGDDRDNAAALMNMGPRARAAALRRRERAHRREMVRDMRRAMVERNNEAERIRLQRMEERDEEQEEQVREQRIQERATRDAQERRLWSALEALGLERADCLTSVAADGTLLHRAPPQQNGTQRSHQPSGTIRPPGLPGGGSYSGVNPQSLRLGAVALASLRSRLQSTSVAGSSSSSSSSPTGSGSSSLAGNGKALIDIPEIAGCLLHGHGAPDSLAAALSISSGQVKAGVEVAASVSSIGHAGARGLAAVIRSMAEGAEALIHSATDQAISATGSRDRPESAVEPSQADAATNHFSSPAGASTRSAAGTDAGTFTGSRSIEAQTFQSLGSEWHAVLADAPVGRLVGCTRAALQAWLAMEHPGNGSSRGDATNELSVSAGAAGKKGKGIVIPRSGIDVDAVHEWMLRDATPAVGTDASAVDRPRD